MSDQVYVCYQCKTHFVFPDGISGKIIRYLLKKGYTKSQAGNQNVILFKKQGMRSIVVYTDDVRESSGFKISTMTTITEIAESENRTPQSVLFDITYDHSRYLRGQIAIFNGFLEETTEGDWLNRMQIEARIERLEKELAEELAKECANE